MWCYNIIGDNEGRISHILRPGPINEWYIILVTNLVSLKRENPEPILTVKITEWRKFINYFGLSIEAKPSRVDKKNLYFPCIGSTPPNNGHAMESQRPDLKKKERRR